MHILLGIPTPEYTQSDFALGNLQDILSYTHKKFPDWKLTTSYKYGTRTDANRNHILFEALKDPSIDYILWLDSDMLYPQEIIEAYFEASSSLKQQIDVIGCLYFKRSHPYSPIAYVDNDNPENNKIKPYKTLHPGLVRKDTLYEVKGLGYGGMMVNMKVYEKLGEKKWTRYGENFHLPFDSEKHMTHDLQFCADVVEAGMSIKLHGGVRPGHLCLKPITIDDWRRAEEESGTFRITPPPVLVIMPTIDRELAEKTAGIMKLRAGADCDIVIAEDVDRIGFIATVNQVAKDHPHTLICYTAQDALVGEYWLKHALMEMNISGAGLVGFNDGKWRGKLASYGLIDRLWSNTIYGENVLFPGYNSHYADTELTQIAKAQGKYAYAPKAIMLEMDLLKALGKGKGVNAEDKKLYAKRKKQGFNGLVKDVTILGEFG